MGFRLSKLYTRTGDTGETGLGDGRRVAKNDARIEAIGAVDELNSALGLVAAETTDAEIGALLSEIQHDLFDLGGELSLPGQSLLDEGRVAWLESELDRLNADLPPLENFILPGGGRAAAAAHLARAVGRRAERRFVTLARTPTEGIGPGGRYLNRLSDFLFVIARRLARQSGSGEVLWKRPRRGGGESNQK